MATGERPSVGFPVDSSFATARQSRERASAQRESTEVDRIKVEIEKLREQLGQYEESSEVCRNVHIEKERVAPQFDLRNGYMTIMFLRVLQ